MRWHARFQATFFSAWERAGLPAPQHHERAYLAQLQALRFDGALPAGHDAPDHPLNRATVDAVFGFGALFGRICMHLMGAPAPREAQRRETWCGRFNLGISLFDFLCDVSGDARRAATLPALQRLLPQLRRVAAGAMPDTEPARFLNDLIERLLAELTSARTEVGGAVIAASLRRTLQTMCKAELAVAGAKVMPLAPAAGLARAVRLKSEEPFRVMCQWAAREAGPPDQSARNLQARALGRALGRCYWLADDAKDLWNDLDAGQWNFFALQAVRIEPALLQTRRDPLVDARLATLLERERIAERACAHAVQRVVRAVDALPCPMHARREGLGMVAAALARW